MILFLATPAVANNADIDDADAWFDDPYFDLEETINNVNEGQLKFIRPILDKPILTTDASLKITEDSLITGLVDMEQCYRQLDRVPALDIVYSFDEIYELTVVRNKNIRDITVADNRLELVNIDKNNEVCVTAQIRILQETSAGEFSLRYGPYFRRFLDGFYPYHIILNLEYPEDTLSFKRIAPLAEDKFEFIRQTNQLRVEAWFEGILTMQLYFQSIE